MLQTLQNDAKFQKFQLDNLVDFEKSCKTRICLQKSGPIQPKTSNTLPKISKLNLPKIGNYPTVTCVDRGPKQTEDGFLDQLEEVYGEDQGPRQLHHSAECSTFGKIFNMDNNDFA